MSKPRNIRFTPELLQAYSKAAITNASELVAEAITLHKHGHFARAYFLAVAAIEETGKAYLAFDGQGRNLSDSSVALAMRLAMENHSQKITSAFTAWLISSPNIRESVMPAIDLMVNLKHGREPSMYTDIRTDLMSIQTPSAVVREKAALDCIRLATDCLSHTEVYISEKMPEQRSRAQDQMFTLKTNQLQKILSTEDFAWYFIAQLEAGKNDMAEAVIFYQENYAKVGLLFREPHGENEGRS